MLLARTLPAWLRFLLALATVGAFFTVRVALGDYLSSAGYAIVMPAIILSAYAFGRGPAVLATVASGLLVAIYFVPPYGGLAFDRDAEPILLAAYFAVGIAIAYLVEHLVNANGRLFAQIAATLEARAAHEEASAQRALLLEDINHRIKNHLQAVAGLAEQARRRCETAEEATAALGDLASRLHVLSRVYDRLRLTDRQAAVNAAPFLGALCDDLQATLVGERPVAILAEAEPIELSTNEAALVGLVANELITNCLKYAFGDGGGTVQVRFVCSSGEGCLSVRDDGVGILQIGRSGTGRRIVEGLARQLKGTVEWSGPPGTLVEMRFPVGLMPTRAARSVERARFGSPEASNT